MTHSTRSLDHEKVKLCRSKDTERTFGGESHYEQVECSRKQNGFKINIRHSQQLRSFDRMISGGFLESDFYSTQVLKATTIFIFHQMLSGLDCFKYVVWVLPEWHRVVRFRQPK